MKRLPTALIAGASALAATAAAGQTTEPALGPPGAQPGECYVRDFIPASFTTQQERVLVRPEVRTVQVQPPRFEEVQQQIEVRPAVKRLEVVPPEFETVKEQIVVRPAYKRLEPVPAEFETVAEQVLVRPATYEWRRQSEGYESDITRRDPQTGEILCLVEVPPEYETITRQVVRTPASTREVEVPAEYATIERQVLKSPASVREVEVPAEYETITVARLAEPAQVIEETLPPAFATVQRAVLEQPAAQEWRQVLCETNTYDRQIAEIERALQSRGFDPGGIDGELDDQTMQAVNAFQEANGLPVDDGAYVNLATAQALGLGLDQASGQQAGRLRQAEESSGQAAGEPAPPTQGQPAQESVGQPPGKAEGR